MLLQTIAFVLCNFSPLIADRCRFGNKHLSSFPSIRKKTTHQKMATCFEFNSCQSAFCTTLTVNSTRTKRCLPTTNKPQRCVFLNQIWSDKRKGFHDAWTFMQTQLQNINACNLRMMLQDGNVRYMCFGATGKEICFPTALGLKQQIHILASCFLTSSWRSGQLSTNKCAYLLSRST